MELELLEVFKSQSDWLRSWTRRRKFLANHGRMVLGGGHPTIPAQMLTAVQLALQAKEDVQWIKPSTLPELRLIAKIKASNARVEDLSEAITQSTRGSTQVAFLMRRGRRKGLMLDRGNSYAERPCQKEWNFRI